MRDTQSHIVCSVLTEKVCMIIDLKEGNHSRLELVRLRMHALCGSSRVRKRVSMPRSQRDKKDARHQQDGAYLCERLFLHTYKSYFSGTVCT